jgi:hypothetical protein
MDSRERTPRAAAVLPTASGPIQGWTERTGWVRCQVMGRPAQLWTPPADTDAQLATTSPMEDRSMFKKAKSRASALLSSSAELYREMALNALKLVRR